jgi:2-dehydropantoate 2-reductase
MKISIIGAGAMGSLYGGKLADTGSRVLLYDINREHVDAIISRGLQIEDLATGDIETVRPEASTDPESVRDSDFIIIFVKSTATEAVARQFKEFTGKETVGITLQNGVGNEECLREHFGIQNTAAGVTSQGATFLGPGKIRHAGKGPTHLCMSDKENEKLNPLVDVMNSAGFETHIEENIENLIWSKLVINIGINALTALTGLKNGSLLDYAETKELIYDLVAEAILVVEGKGLELTYPDPLGMVYGVCEKTGGNRSSMLQDFDRKSQTEIDFINHALVREGEKLGIELPVNKTISLLVQTLDKLHAGVSKT